MLREWSDRVGPDRRTIFDNRFVKGALIMCAVLFTALLMWWPIYALLHG